MSLYTLLGLLPILLMLSISLFAYISNGGIMTKRQKRAGQWLFVYAVWFDLLWFSLLPGPVLLGMLIALLIVGVVGG